MIHILPFFHLTCLLTFHFHDVTVSAGCSDIRLMRLINQQGMSGRQDHHHHGGRLNYSRKSRAERETAFHEHTQRLPQKETQILSSHTATIPIKGTIEESCSEQDFSSTRYGTLIHLHLHGAYRKWLNVNSGPVSVQVSTGNHCHFLFSVRTKLSKWSN